MAAVRKTAYATAIISALAATGHIRARVWQSHRVFQSVILRRLHKILVWCIIGMRWIATAHVVRIRSVFRVCVYGVRLNPILQVVIRANRVSSAGRILWMLALFSVEAYQKTHLLDMLLRRVVERMRSATKTLTTITAFTHMSRVAFNSSRWRVWEILKVSCGKSWHIRLSKSNIMRKVLVRVTHG